MLLLPNIRQHNLKMHLNHFLHVQFSLGYEFITIWINFVLRLIEIQKNHDEVALILNFTVYIHHFLLWAKYSTATSFTSQTHGSTEKRILSSFHFIFVSNDVKGTSFERKKITDHIRNEKYLHVPYYTEIIRNNATEFFFIHIFGEKECCQLNSK